jgi:RHS repeat-associated protein
MRRRAFLDLHRLEPRALVSDSLLSATFAPLAAAALLDRPGAPAARRARPRPLFDAAVDPIPTTAAPRQSATTRRPAPIPADAPLPAPTRPARPPARPSALPSLVTAPTLRTAPPRLGPVGVGVATLHVGASATPHAWATLDAAPTPALAPSTRSAPTPTPIAPSDSAQPVDTSTTTDIATPDPAPAVRASGTPLASSSDGPVVPTTRDPGDGGITPYTYVPPFDVGTLLIQQNEDPDTHPEADPDTCPCSGPGLNDGQYEDRARGNGQPFCGAARSGSNSSVNPHPIITADWTLGATAAVPDKIEARLTLGSVTGPWVHYTPAGLAPGQTARIALMVDASTLPTGRHPVTLEVKTVRGAAVATTPLLGHYVVFNRVNSPYGHRRWIADVDRVLPSTGGVTLVRGNASAAWFASNGSGGYITPDGSTTVLTNVAGGGWRLTARDGSQHEFNADGWITAREDRNGNRTTYSYIDADGDGQAGELSQSVDPFGRVANYAYAGGLLVSMTDFSGRTTTYGYSGNRVTSITQVDPDGAGPLAPSTTQYGYDARGLITSITDPNGLVTTIAYDAALRVRSITRPGRGTETITPVVSRLLVDPATGAGTPGNPAPMPLPSDAYATVLDAAGATTRYRFDAFGYVTEVTDPLGNVTTIERNSHGWATRITRPDPDGPSGPLAAPVTTLGYDAKGNLTGMTLPDGRTRAWGIDLATGQPLSYRDEDLKTWSYVLDAKGNRTRETDPLNRVTDYTYTARGQLATITRPDPDGAGPLPRPVTTFTYDVKGRLEKVTHPDATFRAFGYNTSDDLTTATDEAGRTTTFVYDAMGRRTGVTLPDPDGPGGPLNAPSYATAYRPDGTLDRATDALGRVTVYGYDTAGRLATVTLPDPDGAGPLTSPVTSFGYDAVDRPTTVTDPLGNVTTTAYDVAGRPTSITRPDPDGAGPLTSPVTTFAYDNLDRLVSATDPLGAVTSIAYNSRDFVTSVTLPDPDGAGPLVAPVTFFAYDPVGRPTTTTDALGRVTTRAYDAAGQLTSVTLPDPDGAGPQVAPVTSYAHDPLGRLVTVTAPLSRVTSYAYDNRDRLVGVTLPDPDAGGPLLAPTLAYGYDTVGNRTSATDPLGKVTTYAFDDLDRLLTTTLPDPDGAGPLLAPVTGLAYDAVGNLTALVDPLSNTTNYAYDNLDRLTQTTDPLGKSTYFTYDAASRLTERKDRLNRRIQSTYDNLGRVTAERWYAPNNSLQRTITSAYDAADRLTSVSDPDAALTFAYDAIGRLATAGTSGTGSGQPNLTLTYAYDAVGNRTRMTDSLSGTGWAGAGVTDYTYDNLDRLIQQSRTLGPNNGPRVTFSYDTASRMTSMSRTIGGTGTAVTSTLGYDALDRLTSLSHQVAGGATLATYAYAYDVASRLTSETNAEGTANYSYDTNAQLLAADRPGTADDEAYAYDRNGNRTLTGYTTGANNRVTASPGFTYTYDDEGNLLTRVQLNGPGTTDDLTTTYAYDHRNRLTGVTTRNASNVVVASANFRYDPLDRRIRTNLDSNGAASGGVTTTWTAYDGGHAYADFANNGALQTRYLHGPAVDMLLARTSAAGVSAWYLTDRQGSVRDLVSTSGAVLNHVVYDAYGRVKSETNAANGDRFKYTGRETDAVTGLQYNRARYYDAVIGRWTQEDPIGYSAGDSNLYRYVGNSPVNAADPSGLFIDWSLFNPWSYPNGDEIRKQRDELDEMHKLVQEDHRDRDRLNSLWDRPPSSGTPEDAIINDRTANGPLNAGFDRTGGRQEEAIERARRTICEDLPGHVGDRIREEVQDGVVSSGVGKLATALPLSIKFRIKRAQLPHRGKIRYVPPENYTPTMPLPRGPRGGYIDRFGNEWVKGSSRTPGQAFEWDVQLGRNCTPGMRAISPDGDHVNVSLDGEVTH